MWNRLNFIFCHSFDLWLYTFIEFSGLSVFVYKAISKAPYNSCHSVILTNVFCIRDTVLFTLGFPDISCVFPFLCPLLHSLISSSHISGNFACENAPGLNLDLCSFPSIYTHFLGELIWWYNFTVHVLATHKFIFAELQTHLPNCLTFILE